MLPEQCRRLGDLADVTRGALGITQDGSVLHIQAAEFTLSIDARGKTIGTIQYIHPNQEQLC
jgi:hypothetical protein